MRISDWSSDVCSSDLVRNRAGGGPPFRAHAAVDEHPGARVADLLARAVAPGGATLSLAVPVPAGGAVRRVPDWRPVQPVRVLRTVTGSLLWPRTARLRHRAGEGQPPLYRRQLRGLDAVPDTGRAPVCTP